jgi:serine/threonine protein kinase
MSISISNNTLERNKFINPELSAHFINAYKNGETGLGRFSHYLRLEFNSLKSKFITEITDNSKEIYYQSLYTLKTVCELAKEAEEEYYKTFWGGCKKKFQEFLKNSFKTETSLEGAENLLKELDKELGEKQAELEVKNRIAQLEDRAFHFAETKTARFLSLIGNKKIQYTTFCKNYDVTVDMNSNLLARPTPKCIDYMNSLVDENGQTVIDANHFIMVTPDGTYRVYPGQELGKGGERIVINSAKISSQSLQPSEKSSSILDEENNKITTVVTKEQPFAWAVSTKDKPTIKRTKRAVDFLNKFNCKEVIKAENFFRINGIGYFDKKNKGFSFDENDKAALLITGVYPCDLKKLLKENQLTQKQKKHLILSLIKIAQKLKEAGVIHHDIKPDNFLVRVNNSDKKSEDHYELVLTDFGMAVLDKFTITDLGRTFTNFASLIKRNIIEGNTRKKCYGTAHYFSPEYAKAQLNSDKDKTQAATESAIDIWSIGLTCYYILKGSEDFKTHFTGLSEEEWLRVANKTFLPKNWDNLGKEQQTQFRNGIAKKAFILKRSLLAQEEINTLLNKEDPIERLILQMLQVNPKQRANATRLEEMADQLPEEQSLPQIYEVARLIDPNSQDEKDPLFFSNAENHLSND